MGCVYLEVNLTRSLIMHIYFQDVSNQRKSEV